jgi:YegS/Rv2252/BmrU family lipid kinase
VLHATLIYNPLAGPANLATTIRLVADSWRVRGWQVEVCATRARGHAIQLARSAAARSHALVFAAGGDGTLGEVVNGLAGSETIMAPLPVGTANSFAKELLIPRPNLLNQHRLLVAADLLATGRVQRVDLGYTQGTEGQGRYWLLWSGTGADGFLVDQVEPRPRWSKKLGRLGYFVQSLMVLPRIPTMRASVEIDGQLFEDELLLVLASNCRRYAGGEILLSRLAKLDDGLFEVWLFQGAGMWKTLYYFRQAKLERLGQDGGVTMVSGHRVQVASQPVMPFQTDGEPAGSTPFLCELRSRSLRLLVPEAAPVDLFQYPGEKMAELYGTGHLTTYDYRA